MRKVTIVVIGIIAALTIAVFLFHTPDTDPFEMRAKYGGPPSRFVDLGGGLIVHLRDTGPRTSPVIMLVHGANASLHTWEGWAARLDPRYRVVRMDLPGHGLTGPSPTHDYRPRALAEVVERIRAKLGIAKIVLVGSSMGGGVAWHYALLHPERLRGLVLVDSAGAPLAASGNPPLVFSLVRTPIIGDLALVITPRDMVADGVRSAFHDPRRVTDEAIDRAWELLRYPGNRRAMLDRFAQVPDVARAEELRTLMVPVLILWGADDRQIPPASGQWLHAHIPGSTMITYASTGHNVMEERADQSAADVARFVAASDQQGAKP